MNFYVMVLGVDPGAKYTAFVAVEIDGSRRNVVWCSTLERGKTEPVERWAVRCGLEADRISCAYWCSQINVEGVNAPKGFSNGKKSFVKPTYLVDLSVAYGGLYGVLEALGRHVTVVPPGGNGSRAAKEYPACISGRRDDVTPGVTEGGSRRHERSAYDIACA